MSYILLVAGDVSVFQSLQHRTTVLVSFVQHVGVLHNLHNYQLTNHIVISMARLSQLLLYLLH